MADQNNIMSFNAGRIKAKPQPRNLGKMPTFWNPGPSVLVTDDDK